MTELVRMLHALEGTQQLEAIGASEELWRWSESAKGEVKAAKSEKNMWTRVVECLRQR